MENHAKNGKIITKYKQYLKLEKSFSSNTIDAYLTDLDKTGKRGIPEVDSKC